jgi:hypothetical protein
MNLKTLRLVMLLFLALPAAAQFTTVTGTVTDPNSVPYAFGTITPILVTVSGSGTPTLGGFPYAAPTQPTGLDKNGSFVVNLGDNNVIVPAGSKWNFQVCSAVGTVQPSGGKGPVCFQLAAPITITGASQSITANLAAVPPPALSFAGSGTTINPTNNVLPKRSSASSFADSALTDNGTTVTSSEILVLPNGTLANPSLTWSNGAGQGFRSRNANTLDYTGSTGSADVSLSSAGLFTNVIKLGNGGDVVATGVLLITGIVPTIAGAGCGGSGASIPSANGTAAFTINVGTAPTSGGCTITLPAAATDWVCSCRDRTTKSTTVSSCEQSNAAASTTSAVLQIFTDVAVAAAPVANDILRVSCFAY